MQAGDEDKVRMRMGKDRKEIVEQYSSLSLFRCNHSTAEY